MCGNRPWRRLVLALGAWCALVASAEAAAPAWQPAACPIPTRWSKEVTPEKTLPEYPRPQMVRPDWLNLNGLWQFAIAPADAAAPVGEDLPGRILVPFPIESALSGVAKALGPGERLWYRRTVEIPKGWADRRVLLHFGAVDWETAVYVNGNRVGTHRGGYDALTFDITASLDRAGLRQEILVGVLDPTDQGEQPRGRQALRPEGGRFSASSGIWQTVWLEPVPAARITALAMTPDLAGKCLRLKVAVSEGAAGAEVGAAVREGETDVAHAFGPAGEEFRVPVPTMRLWTPESPYLYNLHVSLGRGERPSDAVDSYFGMRKVEVASDGRVRRILLNGKPVFQVGVLDPGYWPDGLYTAPSDAALRFDLETAKKLGFNMVRKHAKVEPDRWYTWADKLGLLVWQDMPGGENRTPAGRSQFEAELDRMAAGLGNHPSIITWTLFDEGGGQFDTERLVARVRAIDPTRLVDAAGGWRDEGAGDLVDTHHLPAPEALPPEAARASAVGGFGAIPMAVPGHTWRPVPAAVRGTPADTLTGPYEKLLAACWKLRDYPGVSAAIYTQLYDVEGEYAGLMTYDREVAKGDVGRIMAANRGNATGVRP